MLKKQYDINRTVAERSISSIGNEYKYEYFTGEEILPQWHQRIIEKAKFTYSPLRKANEMQTKTTKVQGKGGGGVEALYYLDITNEINKLNAVPQNNVICDKSK